MLSRKKARRIVIDEIEYFWVASGQDGWLELFVERDIAGSPKLSFMFPYGSEHGQSQVSVTPHVVRRAILYALENGWTPSEPGKDLRFGRARRSRRFAYKVPVAARRTSRWWPFGKK